MRVILAKFGRYHACQILTHRSSLNVRLLNASELFRMAWNYHVQFCFPWLLLLDFGSGASCHSHLRSSPVDLVANIYCRTFKTRWGLQALSRLNNFVRVYFGTRVERCCELVEWGQRSDIIFVIIYRSLKPEMWNVTFDQLFYIVNTNVTYYSDIFVVKFDVCGRKLPESCGLTCTDKYDLLCMRFYVLHVWNAY